MNEKKEEAAKDLRIIEVELLGDHTHQGTLYHQGDKITIHKRQIEKLREWGKVK